MWTSLETSSSEEESDDDVARESSHLEVQPVQTRTFEPFQRNQSFFMANLAKLLDEAPDICMSSYIRWHPGIHNAMQIN